MASRRARARHNRRKILQLGLSAAFVPTAPAIVRAQASDLPAGPIRVILPTLHGGQADTLGRLIGDRVGPAIDRSFVMEPRAGAGGLIAGEYVARADARRQHAAVRHRRPHHPARPLRSHHQVRRGEGLRLRLPDQRVRASRSRSHPSIRRSRSPICWSCRRRIRERSRSAAPGVGSTQHLIGEVCQERFGVKWTHVPYPGGAGPVNDVIGGRVDMAINSMLTLAPLVNGGTDAGAGGELAGARSAAARARHRSAKSRRAFSSARSSAWPHRPARHGRSSSGSTARSPRS